MMKLERLEDIRKYVEDAGETWYYRGMLSELIGHIDELHKAVSVDTSGAVDFGAGIIDPNRIAQILVNGKWVDAGEEWEDIRSRILAISPVHHDNCDGSSGPYWVCRMCGEHTSGEYENKPSPLDMHHSSECPIDALRSAKGEVK